ncbi:hypothetical protein P691DRAFT_654979 [Macrolepiota fuliginosa MF-IS2]|uniref:DH domain-containing protein n=1 Tax=Macrolepiota fuliginosa MF-IS2 TaxID=1400762 RepID=A0A9P6CBA6_9AGAR|nr:hypothetical protein P691DRAFT_654979 [Macrolepiota fuliginosa MF-IS2]
MHLPDPSHFPDPYPSRTSHHHLASPSTLSSAGSSSTRSSAYTSSGSALASTDYAHIHVASGDDDGTQAGTLTPESFSQILPKDDQVLPRPRVSHHKSQLDQGRWSESYSSSIRSRSSSLGNNSSGHGHETSSPNLKEKPSYDMGWIVDEKDEVGLSEEETDDDQPLTDDHDGGLDEAEEERTSAAVIADEGRGLIIQADSTPIVQLQVQPGTTHLLIGSSTTPNAVPAFLANTLPQICHSLLALDISANFLSALPPILAVCTNLEELNVASNPLRVLPVFLADLANLRVLIADSTIISTLPDAMVDLDKLHTISIRRNKLHALPGWLCMLPALQTLCVDHNPFQGPWKALVEPLLAKTPMTPMYPPSTPIFPLPSGSFQDSNGDTEADATDIDEMSDVELGSGQQEAFIQSPEDEDQTITPDRAPHLGRAVTSPLPVKPQASRGLSRTRTTPNRTYFEQTRTKPGLPSGQSPLQNAPPITRQQSETAVVRGDRELRKMKSAGDLRRGKSTTAVNEETHLPIPSPKATVTTSQSSINLTMSSSPPPAVPPISKRYGSLGPASSLGSPTPRPNLNAMRSQLSTSLWDNPSDPAVDPSGFSRNSLASSSTGSSQPPPIPKLPSHEISDGKGLHRSRPSRDGKDKGSRWGFLKKMSMGKIKVEPPPPLPPHPRPNSRPSASASASPIPDRFSKTPQIDLRFSTSGLDAILPPLTPPQTQKTPPPLRKQPSSDLLRGSPSIASTTTLVSTISTVASSTTASNSLLAPLAPTSRAGKRRSFLPIDAPGPGILNIPIPDNSKFVPGVTATGDSSEDAEARVATPSPTIDAEQYQRKEEERAREAYMRALRSVMAYLKDMNDLSLSQQTNPLSMYGHAPEEMMGRARRPTTTVSDNLREVSIALSGTTIAPSTVDGASQLRPAETIAGLRSGTSSQTMSVATTDSNGSSEERKYKDDKGKRAMIIKEIVVTERTYVKGLQELVDIYIKPGTMPVNILSGVGSGKETVVPMSERKIVFAGIEALFSFHNESFLPALEKAAALMMQSREELQQADADGQMSMNVAKAVGDIFVKHAAFMKMYSSYINNFDNSVQRVKYWTSDRQVATAPPSTVTSPASSTVQLASLGLSMSVVPGVTPDVPGSTGFPTLSTSQRRRLKSYLKRCRMSPRHTQLNLEGYLLLPVQRIPRYRLLLEELLRNTPPVYEYMEDPLDRALAEISSLANNMNEGKRESESRHKLVQWQARIRGRFPSPLVQPHRRLIMDGPLLLTRVVRKAVVSFDTINSQGDVAAVQVDCLTPELTPRPLIGILCNDLLVLCRDPSDGQDPNSQVDLWAVLRMQTLPQPASIVHGNALRLVDNKAILYFDAPSPSDALNWYRAINLHIPASKT